MAGILKIVATPIGNLKDISLRAIESLRHSSAIFAESIAQSRKLLTALDINLKNIRLISCGQQEEEARIKVALERLCNNETISFISDAGTPNISDPGGRLVEAVIEAGYKIEVIPGPSAFIAALMGAGLITTRFAFLGFLSKKKKEREVLVKNALNAGLALVIYEAPNRVLKTLEDLHNYCGPKRVVVARELTKQFETFHRGILGQSLNPTWVEKGEAVIVIENNNQLKQHSNPETIEDRIQTLLANPHLSPKEMAKQLSKSTKLTSKEAYKLILNTKTQLTYNIS